MGIKPSQLTDQMRRCIPPDIRKAMGKDGLTFDEALLRQEARDERKMQDLISNLLHYHEIPFSRSRMDKKTRTAKGTPDFLFAVRGVPFAWEVKTPDGRLSQEQLDKISAYQIHGWRVTVVRAVSEAVNILKEAMG